MKNKVTVVGLFLGMFTFAVFNLVLAGFLLTAYKDVHQLKAVTASQSEQNIKLADYAEGLEKELNRALQDLADAKKEVAAIRQDNQDDAKIFYAGVFVICRFQKQPAGICNAVVDKFAKKELYENAMPLISKEMDWPIKDEQQTQ